MLNYNTGWGFFQLVELVNKMRQEISEKTVLVEDLSTQAESLQDNVQELNRNISNHDKHFQKTQEEAETKLRYVYVPFSLIK